MLIYQDNNFASITDPNLKYANALLQELQLFKGENPIDIESGIDYLAVFNGSKFLKSQVEDVCEKYEEFFDSITVGEVEEDGEIAKISIHFVFKNGDSQSTDLKVSAI